MPIALSLRPLRHCLAGAAAMAAASSALAQDSVTIYGIADMYVEGINGGTGNATRLQSGGLSGSRLGFRGRHEMGGGLYSNFTLETGLNMDDGSLGQGGVMFGRQAFVGLGGESWGWIGLGRQYSSLYNISDQFSIFSSSPTGPSSAVVGGFGGYEPVRGSGDSATGNGGPARLNNSVRYESPVWGGFRFGVAGGFGEVVDDSGQRVFDAYARYAQGPVDIAAGYLDDRGGPVNALAERRTWIVGGAYLQVDDRTLSNQDGAGWWVGADYRLGASLVKIQYVENRPRYVDDARTQGLGVGYEYSLSRRTTLYAAVSYFRNQENAGLGRASFSIPSGITGANDNDLTQWVGGMRFSF